MIRGIIPGSTVQHCTSRFLLDHTDCRDRQPYPGFLDSLSCYSILLLCFLSFLFLCHSGDAHGFLLALCSGFTPDSHQDPGSAGPVCALAATLTLAPGRVFPLFCSSRSGECRLFSHSFTFTHCSVRSSEHVPVSQSKGSLE